MSIALMTLAEWTTRSGRSAQKSFSVRTANETWPVRLSAQARASLTCGRQFSGASATAGAAAASEARTRMAGAARRTARESTLPGVDQLQFAQALTPKELETLEDLGEPGSFAAGETIFAEGESSDRVLLVRTGRVRITARAPSGADVELAERGPGELLGDLSGIDGRPRSASVVATEDVTGLVVPLRGFRGFLMDHPRVALSLLELVSRRLRESDARRVAGS